MRSRDLSHALRLLVYIAAAGASGLAVLTILTEEPGRENLEILGSRYETWNALPLAIGALSAVAVLLGRRRRPFQLALLAAILAGTTALNLMDLREDGERIQYPLTRHTERSLTERAQGDGHLQVQLKYAYLSLRPYVGDKTILWRTRLLNSFALRAVSNAAEVGREVYEDELSPREFDDVVSGASIVLSLGDTRSLYLVESRRPVYRVYRFGEEVVLK